MEFCCDNDKGKLQIPQALLASQGGFVGSNNSVSSDMKSGIPVGHNVHNKDCMHWNRFSPVLPRDGTLPSEKHLPVGI